MITTAPGIYRIRNLLTARVYIGSAVNMAKRLTLHVHHLRQKKHHSRKLQRAWDKAGELQFVFEVVEVVPDRQRLIEREQYWLDLTKACVHGYNSVAVAGSTLGMRHSEATKAKIAAKHLGRKMTEADRARMSAASKGKPKSHEHRQRISAGQVGKVNSQEARKKMSIAAKARAAKAVRKSDGTFAFGAQHDVKFKEQP